MVSTRTGPAVREDDLLAAAKAGDEAAFGRLIERYRRQLHAHAYRMVGSAHDAEDALQDTMLRAWRGLAGFDGRSSLRAWLYRITTNASLDLIGRRPKRVLPLDYGPPADPHDRMGPPLVETAWLEPFPDQVFDVDEALLGPDARYEQRESVELAFVAALQHLPPRQRAVLILREVLGFSAQEVSDTLDSTVASVNSALQRARKTIDDALPDRTQQATLRELGDQRVQELVETYMTAWEAGDVDTVVSLLTEDVTMAMPPAATWFRGLEACIGFLTNFVFARQQAQRRQLIEFAGEERRTRLVPTRANGQLAFGNYQWNEEAGAYLPVAIQVLTLRGDRIRDITAFVNPALARAFELPERIEEDR